jgi:hypothetical protein
MRWRWITTLASFVVTASMPELRSRAVDETMAMPHVGSWRSYAGVCFNPFRCA